MSTMKLWENKFIGNHGYRRAVPGGWVVSENSLEGGVACCFVPDPAAPHCRPAPSPVGPPPMTDDDLIAWLTATYGEPQPISAEIDGARWWLDDACVSWATVAPDAGAWQYGTWDVHSPTIPAHIAGPALWAAHHFGGAP